MSWPCGPWNVRYGSSCACTGADADRAAANGVPPARAVKARAVPSAPPQAPMTIPVTRAWRLRAAGCRAGDMAANRAATRASTARFNPGQECGHRRVAVLGTQFLMRRGRGADVLWGYR